MKLSNRHRGVGGVLFCVLALPALALAQSSANPKLVEAAKKEGQVIYYTTMTLDQSKAVADRFEKNTASA